MNRVFLSVSTLALAFFSFSLFKNKDEHSTSKGNDEIWRVDIGKTSYRTNVTLSSDYVIIGSNGDNYMDYNISDNRNGVHIINRVNGKKIKNFGNGSFGDLDVNGTLIHQGKIFFGNDNDEFICADFNGNIKYSLPISGDVECEPIAMKIGGKDAIVFGTEAGELRAINPSNGETIWQHLHENFDGWKMGDNRLVFKIKTHFRSGYLFYFKPILKDLNKDGVEDLVFFIRKNFYAVNGKNGELLHNFKLNFGDWKQPNKNYTACDAESIRFFEGKNGKLNFVIPKYQRIDIPNSYSHDGYKFFMTTYDLNGNIIDSTLIDQNTKSSDFKRIPNTNIYTNGDKIYHFNSTQGLLKIVDMEKIEGQEIMYSTCFTSNQHLNYKGQNCIVILFEEEKTVCLFNTQTGKIVQKFELEERSEFIPVIQDINKDGKMDILVADDSGKLTCIPLGPNVKILN